MCKKALVVSSGGSKGAYAGGIIEYLMQKKNWDIFVGSSTGSLISSMIACGDISHLKEHYTNISPNKIYTRDPFIIKSSNNGIFKFSINHFNIILNLIMYGKKTLGNTYNLRLLISEVFTENHFNFVINSDKDIIICVTNLTTRSLETKSIKDFNYIDFCDWIWASTCAPPFMSIVEKNNFEYVDGGVIRAVPIKEAIIAGATEIDAIVLNEKENKYPIEKVRNALHLIQMISRTMLLKNQEEDLDLSKLKKEIKIEEDIRLNIYHTHRDLTNNSLLFDKQLMNQWWEEGYLHAEGGNYSSFIISRNHIKEL